MTDAGAAIVGREPPPPPELGGDGGAGGAATDPLTTTDVNWAVPPSAFGQADATSRPTSITSRWPTSAGDHTTGTVTVAELSSGPRNFWLPSQWPAPSRPSTLTHVWPSTAALPTRAP